jgi:hypothetical protein
VAAVVGLLRRVRRVKTESGFAMTLPLIGVVLTFSLVEVR